MRTLSYADYGLEKPDASVHSHPMVPSQFNSEKESMGNPMERDQGPLGDNLKVRSGLAPKFNYVYFPESKHLYNVEVNNPRYIRTINKWKDFYFGTLNTK